MSNNEKIAFVADCNEKYITYKANISRYNSAIKHEFYFEAMLIDYAMLEDRLRAFLYFINLLAEPTEKSTNKKVKRRFVQWGIEYNLIGENPNLSIYKISHKCIFIRASLLWAENGYKDADTNKYLQVLSDAYKKKLDIPEFINKLDEIGEWCNYRNEVIHGVMNKNLDSLNAELADRVLQGMELARYIDKMVSRIKRCKSIRKYR